MRTVVSSKMKIVAILISLVFILTACGESEASVDFANPNKAIDAYKNDQNIVGQTVNVIATLSDTGSSSSLCSFYSEGYNGSFKENVLVMGMGDISIEKDETYTITITEVRHSNNTYVIEGNFN